MDQLTEQIIPSLVRKVDQLTKEVRLTRQLQGQGFFTVQQFAHKIGLDQKTVIRYCQNGQLKATRLDDKGRGSWRILCSEYERLITEAVDNHTTEPISPAKRNRLITENSAQK
jgi:hypothetical protein